MDEKDIIKCLIKAFEYAKCNLEYGSTCICSLINRYIGCTFCVSDYVSDNYLAVNSYFLDFFDAEKFGIDFMYLYKDGGITLKLKPQELSFKQRKSFFWFPLDKQHIGKRIEICNKAINMLNEKLKQL